MAEMGPLTSRIRYEEPSYIEEYTAQLSKPNYISYKQRLDTGIIIGKYFILKRYGNLTKKSLRPLPPTAYYGTIMPTEEDLEWKIRFGPYQLRQDISLYALRENVQWGVGLA